MLRIYRQVRQKGDDKPQIKFCNAMASENICKPLPISIEIGTRNKPNTCRTPNVTDTNAEADNMMMSQRYLGFELGIARIPITYYRVFDFVLLR